MSKNTQSEALVAARVEKKTTVKLKSINLQVFVMLAAIVVIMLFFTFTTEGAYLSARNISNLLRQTAITGILAVGMVFVIVSAEIDLSVGSMMGLLGGAAAIFDVWFGWPLPLTIVVTLVAGLLLGAWNGWWVAYRKVPSFIVTLAGMFMATRTAFGRRIYAIGGNIDAARLSGVNVERTKLAVFAINGLMVAIAGLILSSRLGAGSPSAGNIAELDAIAACVIGGTSLAGGIGSVAGAVMGAFIMASLDNGMSMLDVPTFWQYIVKGAILLLAVWMDSATKRRA